MAKMAISEMLRLACIYAVQDREGYLHAIEGTDDELEAETKQFIKELEAYRLKRWGRTELEAAIADAVPVKATDLLKRKHQ